MFTKPFSFEGRIGRAKYFLSYLVCWTVMLGETADSTLTSSLSIQLLKSTLSSTKTVVHSRSSNLYGALNNDDFYQFLGATAMAVRSIDGKSPDVTVTNLADLNQMGQESLDKYIGREMKTRYLNPKWINEMLDDGYSGARMINKVVARLLGLAGDSSRSD